MGSLHSPPLKHNSTTTTSDTHQSAAQETPAFQTPVNDILQLQHLIGNQAVQRLLNRKDGRVLQRDDVGAGGLLSAGAAAGAVNYYKSQPSKYPPNIINQIQEAVGTEQTGEMKVVDVQAVAQWQTEHGQDFNPKLKVDGMAGPRTLPVMFKGGLAKHDLIATYTGEMKEVFNNWDKPGTPEARRQALEKEIGKFFDNVKVPACKVKPGPDGKSSEFDNKSWTIFLKPVAFADLPADPAARNNLAGLIAATLYHESRHAEQDFRIAQMLAGRGKTDEEIFVITQTDANIIKQIGTNKLKPGTMEALIAEGWYDSIYGSGKAHRAAVYSNLAQNQKQYEDLPEETDAHRIGGEVRQTFNKP